MLQSPTVSSASILLAIITALYGLFYPSIKEVIDMALLQAPRELDNKELLTKADNVYTTRVKPLVVGTTIILLIFVPECINQLILSARTFFEFGYKGTVYEFTIAAFAAVTLFTGFQTYNIWNAAIKVYKKREELRQVLNNSST